MSTNTLVAPQALTVDDQHTIRSIARTLLSQIVTTEIAKSVASARAIELIEAPGEAVPNLVICELHMKEVDEIAFCNKWHRHKI